MIYLPISDFFPNLKFLFPNVTKAIFDFHEPTWVGFSKYVIFLRNRWYLKVLKVSRYLRDLILDTRTRQTFKSRKRTLDHILLVVKIVNEKKWGRKEQFYVKIDLRHVTKPQRTWRVYERHIIRKNTCRLTYLLPYLTFLHTKPWQMTSYLHV